MSLRIVSRDPSPDGGEVFLLTDGVGERSACVRARNGVIDGFDAVGYGPDDELLVAREAIEIVRATFRARRAGAAA